MVNITTPDTQKTYGTKKPIPWGVIIVIALIVIVAIFAAIGAVSVFGGSSDTKNSSNQNQQSGDSQSAWFQTHQSAIGSAQADLASKKGKLIGAEEGYINGRCYGVNDAQCQKAWLASPNREVPANNVDRAQARLDALLTEYNTEWDKVDSETRGSLPPKLMLNEQGMVVTAP